MFCNGKLSSDALLALYCSEGVHQGTGVLSVFSSKPLDKIGVSVQVDNKVEEAVKTAMRRVLARLAKLLIGDKKAEVAPLFTVQLSLEKSGRIELRPDVQVAPLTALPHVLRNHLGLCLP